MPNIYSNESNRTKEVAPWQSACSACARYWAIQWEELKEWIVNSCAVDQNPKCKPGCLRMARAFIWWPLGLVCFLYASILLLISYVLLHSDNRVLSSQSLFLPDHSLHLDPILLGPVWLPVWSPKGLSLNHTESVFSPGELSVNTVLRELALQEDW